MFISLYVLYFLLIEKVKYVVLRYYKNSLKYVKR